MSTNKAAVEIIRKPVDETRTEAIDVIRAEYVGQYKIHLWFSDGKNHVVDFEPFLRSAGNPMSRKYLEPELFRQFSLDYGNLQWHDYEMCFSTGDLYNDDIDVEMDDEDRQKLKKVAAQLGMQ